MMKSRKARVGALALAATMALTAGGVASPAQAKEKKLTIGFVVHVVGNPFIQQIIDAAKMAAKDLGVNIKVTGPAGAEGDAQLTAVQNLAAAGVDSQPVAVDRAAEVVRPASGVERGQRLRSKVQQQAATAGGSGHGASDGWHRAAR